MPKNSCFGTWSFAVVAAGALLVGCGGAPEEGAPQERAVKALDTCNPDTACVVSSQYVRCNDGLYMFAYQTDEGWCIERDVCAQHGGALVCPFY